MDEARGQGARTAWAVEWIQIRGWVGLGEEERGRHFAPDAREGGGKHGTGMIGHRAARSTAAGTGRATTMGDRKSVV